MSTHQNARHFLKWFHTHLVLSATSSPPFQRKRCQELSRSQGYKEWGWIWALFAWHQRTHSLLEHHSFWMSQTHFYFNLTKVILGGGILLKWIPFYPLTLEGDQKGIYEVWFTSLNLEELREKWCRDWGSLSLNYGNRQTRFSHQSGCSGWYVLCA